MSPLPPPAPAVTRAQRRQFYQQRHPLPHRPKDITLSPPRTMYETVFVDTTPALCDMLSELNLSTTTPPHLYLDLQGINLSRYGTISILTLFDRSISKVFLVDVHKFGAAAFTTSMYLKYADGDDSMVKAVFAADVMEEQPQRVRPEGMDDDTWEVAQVMGFAGFKSTKNTQVPGNDTNHGVSTPGTVSLKTVLESESIPKVLFDARNDSDALYALYGVKLNGVMDLQVMELATRSGRNRERVNGLAKCIQFGLMDTLSPLQRSQITAIKDRGAKLCNPDKGGSFEVFTHRPLDNVLVHYCVQDVIHLPALWHAYNRKLYLAFWWFVVEEETKKRLEESRAPGYVPQGSHKSLGWTWEHLKQLELKWNA